jgi:hypothetical protein
MTPFDPTQPATWPAALKATQVASIWGEAPKTINRKARIGQCRTAPLDGKPRRWSAAQVARDLHVTLSTSIIRRA